jgi:hypothetical protein
MPSGDAQRTWFPEMVARLRSDWHGGISIPDFIGLRDELDETLHRIRAERKIQTPIITCHRCGMTGHAAEPHVSVRALILALARFQIASKDQTRTLEKEWAAYRKRHRLDIDGRALVGVPQSCPH